MEAVKTKLVAQDGNLHVIRTQDCDPVAEHAAGLRQIGAVGSNEMRHAAHIPMVAIETYCNIHNIEFREFIKDQTHIRAMLNDPALKAFRIWEGKV